MSRLEPNLHSSVSEFEPLILSGQNSSGTISVPDAVSIYTADYSKVADNLVLVDASGRSVVIIDYFRHGELPDLASGNGGKIRGEIVEKLAGALDSRLAQSGNIGEGIPIGQVETVEGSARVQRTDGSTEQLAVGVKIFQNDVLITDAEGKLSVTFADETIFSLSSNSRMVVDELIYDPDSDENSGAFSLIQGGFVFVAGQAAKSGNYEVETPAATMGIRGTNVTVEIVPIDGDTTIALNPEIDGSLSSVIDLYVNDVLAGTLLRTDEQWVILTDGTVSVEPRVVTLDQEETYNDLVLAVQRLLGRLDAGEQPVNSETQGNQGRNNNPADNDFDAPEGLEPDEQPETPDEGNEGGEGETDETQLQDGGGTIVVDNLRNPGDAPVANDVTISGQEDAGEADPISGVLSASAEPGDTLIFELVTDPTDGVAQVGEDGSFSYIPNANFSGTDSFTYSVSNGIDEVDVATVTVNVAPINDPPEASTDAVRILEDQTIVIDPLSNDQDIDGDILEIVRVGAPSNGTVSINADGTLTYVPNANFFGSDQFEYTIADPDGSESTATVFIAVIFENDAPELESDAVTTNEDEPVTFNPLDNDLDADGDVLAITEVGEAGNGTVVINEDNTLTYTPDPDFAGEDSFTYTVSDGQTSITETVNVTIGSVNDTPIAEPDAADTAEDTPVTFDPLANDSDADGDTISIIDVSDPPNGSVEINPDNTLTYTPDANFNGVDTFTYTIGDGQGGTSTATATVAIAFTNDDPVSMPDVVSTDEDVPVTFDPLANDSDVDGDTLAIAEVGEPANGTVIINSDNTLTYTPDPNFGGQDSFSYTLTDGQGTSITENVTVNVGFVNDAPVAEGDIADTDEDMPVTLDPLVNDSDLDGDTITIVDTSDPANGSVVINGDGTLTYTPDANFDGVDSFTYTIGDGQGATSTATVTVTVEFVNDVPVANDDGATTDEDDAITFDPRGNDSDVDGDTLLITDTSDPANGSVIINVDGSLTYTPAANFNGTDSFTYTIEDGRGGADTATVNVTVTPQNDPPVAVTYAASTDEDVPVTFDPRENDTDIDGDALTIIDTSDPANGSVSINGNGTLTYTPDPNFNGTDSFTYTISDGAGGTATETVSVFIGLVNDPPVAADDVVDTDEDVPVTFQPLDNDVDLDGDSLEITTTTAPTNGDVTINANGTLTYTPDADFSGSDSFTYAISDGNGASDTAMVTVNIAPVNDVPVANDDVATTNEDVSVTFAPLGNDTDTDGDPLTITGTSVPSNGSVTINANGTLTYTPDENFNGQDSFTYTINDGEGGTDSATVTVTIASVNDAPVAEADSANVDEDASVTFSPLGNDSDVDGDTLSIIAASDPANGTVGIVGGTQLAYTPDANFNGTDSFTYTISDGEGGTASATVTVTVDPVNDEPVTQGDTAVTNEDTSVTISPLNNDSDVDGDTLTISATSASTNGTVVINANNTLTYTPGANFNGTDSFTYTVNDGQGGTSTSTVTVTVNATNDAPVANDDMASVNEDASVLISPLTNDSDIDGDNLSILSTSTPANGSVEIIAGTSLQYTPNENFNGQDSFTYTISDGNGGTTNATVTVTVNPVNDPPDTSDDVAAVAEDGSVDIAVLSNDTDVDGDGLTVISATNPTNGSVTINANNTVTYSPFQNFNGEDSFTYTVNDGAGGLSTSTVTVTVTATNDDPLLNNDVAIVSEDGSVNIDVLGNDGDPDGDPLNITSTSEPSNGTVNINEDNTLTYAPSDDFNGSDSFTYTVSDGNGGTATATVNVTVTPVNDDPVAANDMATVQEDGSVIIDVLDNDSDIDGDNLVVSDTSDPGSGSVQINEDNTVTYSPDENFNGQDTFTYTVSDGNGGFNTAQVTVTVTAGNDIPVARDDNATVNEDGSVTIEVLNNDSDADEDDLSVTGATDPANGSVVINEDNTITYSPGDDYNGPDSFEYTVSDGNGGTATAMVNITVNPVNDDPVAVDDTGTVEEDGSVEIDVLDNDTDVDGDDLQVVDVSGASDGSVSIGEGNNSVVYTPNDNFNGNDSFTYTVSDGQGGTSTATVNVSVASQNDDPNAEDDGATVDEDGTVEIDVLDNDSDPDGDALSVFDTTDPSNGTVTQGEGDTLFYTPNDDFNGADSFTYTVTDGNGGFSTATVSITINPANDDPIALGNTAVVNEDGSVEIEVLGNDSDIDGDNLTVIDTSNPSNGTAQIGEGNTTVIYTPDDDFNGGDSFEYTVSDGNGGTATATVTVTVNPQNDPPQAVDDTDDVDENQSVTIAVLANDIDIDNDDLAVISVSEASDGEVEINNGTTITYTPDPNFVGEDSFTYTIQDEGGETSTATVTVTVNNVNDPPTAFPDLAITEEGQQTTIDVAGNDFDPDDDPLSIDSFSQGANGEVRTGPGNSLIYDPDNNFYGVDSFNYTVRDTSGETSSSIVTVVVQQDPDDLPNDFPVTVTFNEGSSPGNPGSFDIDIAAVESTNINLYFVLDSSGSITASGWSDIKQATNGAISNFDEDFSGSLTGVDVFAISFSNGVQTVGPFDLVNDTSALQNAINGLPFQAGATNWEAALDALRGQASSQPNGEIHIAYFLTDGNPFPVGQDWQGALNDLNNAVDIDIEAFAIGPTFGSPESRQNLDQIDSDGSATTVTSTSALTAAFDESPLFNAQLLSFTLELNVDGVDQGVIADEFSDLTVDGVGFDLDLSEVPGISSLLSGADIAVFSLTSSFDLDGDLGTTNDVFEVFSVGTFQNSNQAASALFISSDSAETDLVPLTMTLETPEANSPSQEGSGVRLSGVLNFDPNNGDLPSMGGDGSGEPSGPSGPTAFGETVLSAFMSLGLEGTEAQSMPSA